MYMVFDTWFFSFINREVTHVDGLPLPIDQGYLRNQSPKSPNRTQQKAVFFHSQKNRLNPNKSLKVKKRILEELEVPREARTPFFLVKFGSFLSTSWPFAAVEPGWNLYCCWKKRGSVPSLPWSLYGRDDDVSQAAMLFFFFGGGGMGKWRLEQWLYGIFRLEKLLTMAEPWDFAGNLCDLNVFFGSGWLLYSRMT